MYQNDQTYYNPFINQPLTRHKQPKLFEPDEAFMLGNLFKDLYMSYNGFSNYCIQPMNQRQKALLDVQINAFVAHEINLYLDNHPDNQRMIDLYNEYAQKTKESTQAYEQQFGPLTVENTNKENPFQWVQGPWPWECQN